MRLICPSCGAIHSAESWMNDSLTRQCLIIVAGLPWEVSRRCLSYLALFRPVTRGLAWSKALRLLSELQDLVRAPQIQWERKAARPNSVTAWGLAMERMIEKPPKRLPVTSHGYLRSVAYEIADDMDKTAERRRPVERRQDTGGDFKQVSQADMKAITDAVFKKKRRIQPKR